MTIRLQDIVDVYSDVLANEEGIVMDFNNKITEKIKEKIKEKINKLIGKFPYIKTLQRDGQYGYWAGSVYRIPNMYVIIPIKYHSLNPDITESDFKELNLASYTNILQHFRGRSNYKHLDIMINSDLKETLVTYTEILKLLDKFVESNSGYTINIIIFSRNNKLEKYIEEKHPNIQVNARSIKDSKRCTVTSLIMDEFNNKYILPNSNSTTANKNNYMTGFGMNFKSNMSNVEKNRIIKEYISKYLRQQSNTLKARIKSKSLIIFDSKQFILDKY
tara:strand:- start:6058 stop:6882 length:825 start_codon:yes stop_codon:yes gene_type:complete